MLDLSRYILLDRLQMGSRRLEDVVEDIVAFGCTTVNLRDKGCSMREYVYLARSLMALLAPHGMPLLINDRVDVAMIVGAAGVHLGPNDFPYEEARRVLGPEATIGVTVCTADQARDVDATYVDYLSAGPICGPFVQHPRNERIGFEQLAAICQATTLPVIGYGLNGSEEYDLVYQAGCVGVGVDLAYVAPHRIAQGS